MFTDKQSWAARLTSLILVSATDFGLITRALQPKLRHLEAVLQGYWSADRLKVD